MAKRKSSKIVEQKTQLENPTAISDAIAESHPNCLEGNPTADQIEKLSALQKKIDENQLVDKDQTPINAIALYNQNYAELVGKAVKANLEILALNQTSVAINKKLKAKDFVPKNSAKAIVGFIVGDGGLYDKIANMKVAAKNYISKHSVAEARHSHEIMTKQGPKTIPPYINEKNEILDQREKIFGKPNDGYLKPLKANAKDSSRTLYVVARISGKDEFIFTTLQSNDDKLCKGWNNIKFFTPMTTFVNVKGEAKEEGEASDITFSSSSAEDTMTIFRALKDEELDVAEIFAKIYENQLTKLADLESEHELVKDAWDRKFFVKGIVSSVDTEHTDYYGRYKMRLIDPEDNGVEIVVKIPKQVPINFGEGSTVVVLGKSERFVRKEDDKWVDGDVGLVAYGIYAIPDLATPAENIEDQPLDEGTPINGWED